MLYAVNRLQHSMIESGSCIRSKIESFHFYELFFPTSARFSSFPGYTSLLHCTGRIRRGEKPLSEVELAESTANFPWRQVHASHALLLFYFIIHVLICSERPAIQGEPYSLYTSACLIRPRKAMHTIPRCSTMPGESCLLASCSSQLNLLNWPKIPQKFSPFASITKNNNSKNLSKKRKKKKYRERLIMVVKEREIQMFRNSKH